MKIFTTKAKDFTIRFASKEDVSIILGFIKELAVYEELLHEVTATEEILHNNLFVENYSEVIIGEYCGKPIGFSLFFNNFSTFLGKPGIYIEDLYIQPEYRGKGFGKIFLQFIAKLAKERDCGRLEWSCLDWNTPSIEFYKKNGAKDMKEWLHFRTTGQNLIELAEKF